jgi:hypothetical protein
MTGRIEVHWRCDPNCPAYMGTAPCTCGHPGPIALAAARQLATEALAATPGQPILGQKAG